jgi:RNA polymerase sigma factor (sigma-70 family)
MRLLRECSDEELLARVAADDDEAAFAAIVERYKAMMLRVCLRVLHQRQDAEDACQIAFLVLWKKAGLICEGQKLRYWLCCVARREARRIYKKSIRENSTRACPVGF